MQQPGTIDINLTLKAWADIVIEKLRMNIEEIPVIDEGNLHDSLLQTLLVNAGQDIDKIEFSFKLYGIYVDMGVGKETKKGSSGDLGFHKNREEKEWFSKKYYGQIMKLKELLIDKYSQSIAYTMVNILSEDFDQRYKSKGEDSLHLYADTASNLRTVRYRQSNNARTMKNYYKRRESGGQWTNNHKTWKN